MRIGILYFRYDFGFDNNEGAFVRDLCIVQSSIPFDEGVGIWENSEH